MKKIYITLFFIFLLVFSVNAYERKTFILLNTGSGVSGNETNFTEVDPVWTGVKTDYYNKSEVDFLLNSFNLSDYYNKSEIDSQTFWVSNDEGIDYSDGFVGINTVYPNASLHIVESEGELINKSILFNVKDDESLDVVFEQSWYDLITGFGYDVDLVSDDDLVDFVESNVDDYFLLIIRSTGDSYTAHPESNDLNDFPITVLGLDRYVGRVSLGMASSSTSNIFKTVEVSNNSLDWISDYDVDETFNAYDDNVLFHTLSSLKSGVTGIISRPSFSYYMATFTEYLGYDRVFWGIHRVDNMTDESKNIIENLVEYYYDRDGSGYASSDSFIVDGDVEMNGNVKVNDYYFPVSDGDNEEFLQTDGAGVLSWVAVDLDDYVPFSGATSNLDFNNRAISNVYSLDSDNIVNNKLVSELGFFGDYDDSITIDSPTSFIASQIAGTSFNYNNTLFEFMIYGFKDNIMGERILGEGSSYYLNDAVAPDPFDIYLSWDCLSVDDVDGYYIVIFNDIVNGYYGDYYIEVNNSVCNYNYLGVATSGFMSYDDTSYSFANIILDGETGKGYFTGNITANDFITMSKVAKVKEKNSLKKISNANEWLDDNNEIVYNKHYAYVNNTMIDYSKPFKEIIKGKLVVSYPFTKNFDGLSMETRVAELEGMIYELTQELCDKNKKYDFCE